MSDKKYRQINDLTQNEQNEIINLYQNLYNQVKGISVNKLAKLYNFRPSTMNKFLRQNNCLITTTKINPIEFNKIRELFLNGQNKRQLSNLYKVNPTVIGKIIKDLEKPKQTVNSRYYNNIVEDFNNKIDIHIIAKKYTTTVHDIQKVLKQHGIIWKNTPLTQENKQSIIKDHLDKNMTLEELSRKYNKSGFAIKQVLKKANSFIKPWLSKQERLLIVEEYKNNVNLTCMDLGKKYNVADSTINKILKKANIPVRHGRHNLSKDQIKEIIKKYNNIEDYTYESISIEYGINYRTIEHIMYKNRKYLRRKGYSNIHRANMGYTLNDNVFNPNNIAPASAYWIGILYADGNVSNPNNITLGLKLSDYNHLEKFKKFVEGNQQIKIHESNPGGYNPDSKSAAYTFGSVQIRKDLEKFNIVPNKTLTIKPPELLTQSKNLSIVTAFWRGCIDGDGSLNFTSYKYKCGENKEIDKSLLVFQLSFTGTFETIDKFREFAKMINNSDRKRQNFKNGKNTANVQYNGRKALNIAYLLYENSAPETRLDRKYQKYLEAKELYTKRGWIPPVIKEINQNAN